MDDTRMANRVHIRTADETFRTRFNARWKVDPATGCWMWQGKPDGEGYGRITIHGTQYRAHRLSYAIHVGRIDHADVMHVCDNFMCVNPAHLFDGWQRERIDNMTKKGRHSHGVDHARAEMTDGDVLRLRTECLLAGFNASSEARRYGVSRVAIMAAVRGDTWKHVPNAQPSASGDGRAGNGKTTLACSDVRSVRDAWARGVPSAALARRYGIGESAIRKIVQRQTWKHVA